MQDKTPFLLIADDTPDTLQLIEFGVKARGWRCATASTPQEIMAAVEANCDELGNLCFDVMISDIYYHVQQDNGHAEQPKRTGVSVVRELRRKYKNLPVIFITGWDIRMLRNEALSVGQELIAKPFEVDYLLDRAKLWMDWYSPNKFQGTERRRYGINRSGYSRRVTDSRLIVPEEIPRQLVKKEAAQ